MQDLIISSSLIEVELADLGARLLDVRLLTAPEPVSMVCGYDQTAAYLSDPFYLGATVGPIANRIKNAEFNLQTRTVSMPSNQGNHSLHSASWGYHDKLWEIYQQTSHAVVLRLPNDQQNHELECDSVEVRYEVSGRVLRIEYSASCMEPNYLNMTNHAYWNLNSDDSPITNHEFELLAQSVALPDAENIPTGEEIVFSQPVQYRVGESLIPEVEGPLDHHFTVEERSTQLKPMVNVRSPSSGISMQVRSTKPGFQLYCGQYLSAPLKPFAGFCVEPQYLPNAINMPERFSPIVDANTPYRHVMEIEFQTP